MLWSFQSLKSVEASLILNIVNLENGPRALEKNLNSVIVGCIYVSMSIMSILVVVFKLFLLKFCSACSLSYWKRYVKVFHYDCEFVYFSFNSVNFCFIYTHIHSYWILKLLCVLHCLSSLLVYHLNLSRGSFL